MAIGRATLSRGPTCPVVPLTSALSPLPYLLLRQRDALMSFSHDPDRIANADQGNFIFDGIVRHDLSSRGLADDVCDAAISRYNSTCWRATAQPQHVSVAQLTPYRRGGVWRRQLLYPDLRAGFPASICWRSGVTC